MNFEIVKIKFQIYFIEMITRLQGSPPLQCHVLDTFKGRASILNI